ncbi:hypothetical protein HNQ88_003917 [Aureibacter tunicatorum]|uniref:Uncharacterized protein n=1 Tax=Aureibacter tunicatorum TaxID=866807 RepID=A0AAE3XS11_9BACT|nr:hypothetical protein [Aureibacter tunicatorum]BDD06826.1 hypothetical protein AUTU_43090 [Aureibacter tunicatorum]
MIVLNVYINKYLKYMSDMGFFHDVEFEVKNRLA